MPMFDILRSITDVCKLKGSLPSAERECGKNMDRREMKTWRALISMARENHTGAF